MEGQVADLKRRIPIVKRLIAECDRNRAKIHDPADAAYSTYARATASRRDNLRHIADELRTHLGKAEKALREENLQAGTSG